MDVIKDGLAVGVEAHASKEHDFVLISDQFMAPARRGSVPIHGYRAPSV